MKRVQPRQMELLRMIGRYIRSQNLDKQTKRAWCRALRAARRDRLETLVQRSQPRKVRRLMKVVNRHDPRIVSYCIVDL